MFLKPLFKLKNLLLLGAALAFALPALSQNTPVILSTTSDFTSPTHTLIINGSNFGTVAPTVTLDGAPLPLTSFSNTKLTANLPGTLTAGSYYLKVSVPAKDLVEAVTANVGGLQVVTAPSKNSAAAFLATIGAVGVQGPQGAVGPQGIPGPPGLPGPAGPTGANGLTGPAGPAGVPGATGPAGSAGAPGAIGPAGPVGATGAVGPAGPAGVVGIAGPAGAVGPAGPAGVAGPVGPTGSAGEVGPSGPAGPSGPTGATGAAGPVGPAGPAGTTVVFGAPSPSAITQIGGAGATCTVGEIILSASSFYPTNWFPADGSILPINGNSPLFSLIGTNYGGNGTSNFALPDLRSAAPNKTVYYICAQGVFP